MITPDTHDRSRHTNGARAARRARPRDRPLAFRSGDRLPVLARSREDAVVRSAERRHRATTTSTSSGRSRTSGCAAGRCGAGCRRRTPDKPIYVFETGGSTGVPKSRIAHEDFRIDYEIFSETLPDDAFPKGADWLMLGPSGPRRLRLAVEHLAQHRGGICFMVDLDPRWVIKLIKSAADGAGGGVQAPRDRSGADAPARARQHQVHVHDAEAARGAVREGVAEEDGDHAACSAAAPR